MRRASSLDRRSDEEDVDRGRRRRDESRLESRFVADPWRRSSRAVSSGIARAIADAASYGNGAAVAVMAAVAAVMAAAAAAVMAVAGMAAAVAEVMAAVVVAAG